MTKILVFRTDRGEFGVPVEHVVGVRLAEGIVPLPSPRPGVVGMFSEQGKTMTVLAPFGDDAKHALILDDAERSVAVLVGEVTSIVEFDEHDIGSVPPGQQDKLVAGVVSRGGRLTMIVDVDVLVEMLGS